MWPRSFGRSRGRSGPWEAWRTRLRFIIMASPLGGMGSAPACGACKKRRRGPACERGASATGPAQGWPITNRRGVWESRQSPWGLGAGAGAVKPRTHRQTRAPRCRWGSQLGAPAARCTCASNTAGFGMNARMSSVMRWVLQSAIGHEAGRWSVLTSHTWLWFFKEHFFLINEPGSTCGSVFRQVPKEPCCALPESSRKLTSTPFHEAGVLKDHIGHSLKSIGSRDVE